MPIKPPRLDDRHYDDIVREARALIPQYTPEWTHLGDSDPGMTLVQLFAWMTEMTLYRLNRVPDKTYIHFLNFIGEERRPAKPALAPLSFALRAGDRPSVEVPAWTRTSTRQRSGGDALHFLTTRPVSVHGAHVTRMVAVHAADRPRVREIPFVDDPTIPQVLHVGDGQGVQVFDLDPLTDGPDAYTADQFVYVRHDDFRRMRGLPQDAPSGTLRIRGLLEAIDDPGLIDPGLPIGALFDWEHGVDTPDGLGWEPLGVDRVDEVQGLPELQLDARLPQLADLDALGEADDPLPLPEGLDPSSWIRGRVRYERWLARLMEQELRVTWRDDRGGEERELTNWFVRDVGRTLELFVQNLPPIRAGWAIRLLMVDHGLPAGREGYFPHYRWSYRRGNRWLPIPDDQIEVVGAGVVISGPLTEMATDGFNLRAERVEAVNLQGVLPGLRARVVWRRPIERLLASGPEDDGAVPVDPTALPHEPFQTMPTLPPLLGMKFYLGGDVLANRRRSKVLLEVELGFEREGELVEEPVDDYHLQLTYRTSSGWRTVHGDDVDFAKFTVADLDPDGATQPVRRRLRIPLDPVTQLDGLVPWTLGGQSTCWLRLELTKANLSWRESDKTVPIPVTVRVYDVQLGLEDMPGADAWDEDLPGVKVVGVEQRTANRRFSRLTRRVEGEVVEEHPFDDLVETDDPDGVHRALYLQLDRPLPKGQRLTFGMRCHGETFAPSALKVRWEMLVGGRGGVGRRWLRLVDPSDPHAEAYDLTRTGVLAFPLDEAHPVSEEGTWIRAVLRRDDDGALPILPPLTHVMPNTVEGWNLHGFRIEKFSGEGVPHQVVQLRHFPVFLPDPDDVHAARATDLHVTVEEEDGERRSWRVAPGNTFTTCHKDDRVFVVDPVEGTLTFGNGIRGRILPVGSFNVVVEAYHTVPGAQGNVGPGAIEIVEGFGDLLEVCNLLPATGGRHAESIEEILRRAPSILTSRDRAVTRQDFETIAGESSSEVARAACVGEPDEDGTVTVVLLPRRHGQERLPDPFLAAGLQDHVQRYLARRCLVNVRPKVVLARFVPVDVAVTCRLRPFANPVQVREDVDGWVRRFLDPYEGGLERDGWPFGGTLYAQDFGRLVSDVDGVRHVVEVRVYPAPEDDKAAPAWETSPGVHVLPVGEVDLIDVRHVRVVWQEDRS